MGLVLVGIAIVGAVLLYRMPLKSKAPTATSIPSGIEAQPSVPDSIPNQIQQLEAMWKQHPVHAPIALQLGNLHADQHHHDEAVKYYRAFLALDTAQDAWEIRLDIAKEYYLMGKEDSSYTELVTAAKDHPDHPGVLYNLGALAANKGDDAMARQCWNRVMVVAPQSQEAKSASEGLQRLGR